MMLEEVKALLLALGVQSDNELLLQHIILTVEEQIKNETNQRKLPEELHRMAVYAAHQEIVLELFRGWA